MEPRELMSRYLQAARRGDWQAAYGHYAEDIVGHVPGRSTMAGELRGRDALRRYIETARALSHGHDVELELVDMLVGSERVALLVREIFHTPAGPVEIRRANVYRVSDGKIVEIWIYEHDQYAVDALLAG